MSSLSTSLKNSFQRYLHPYEEWVKSAKPGVQQQFEAEQGGPITPSGSPMKKLSADSKSAASPLGSLPPDSPAGRASTTLNTSVVGTPDNKSDTDMVDDSPIRGSTPATNGGFTAGIPAGGFTAVNAASSGFTSVNMSNGMKRELDTPPSSSRRSENGVTHSKRSTPDSKAGSILKRGHSQENGSADVGGSGKDANGTTEESENGERRSKRLKKGVYPFYNFRLSFFFFFTLAVCGCT